MMRTLFFAFLILLFVSPAKADDFNYKAFSELPVQHGGRIKPANRPSGSSTAMLAEWSML